VTRDRAFFLGILVVLLAASGWAAARRDRPVPEARVTGRPIQLVGDGYVSSQTCQACHPSQYASWHRSYHRTMTQIATPETVAARLDGVLEQRGREIWAEFADPDRSQSEVGLQSDSSQSRVGLKSDLSQTRDDRLQVRRRVVMTTGSHHQQIYWYATGNSRMLGQLPMIWLTADQKWIPRRAALMAPPPTNTLHAFSETGAWNGVCVACHTTNGRPAFDTPFGSQPVATQTADTTAVEFGIACESCHGPAAEHIARNRNPWRRYSLHFSGAADATIVQPRRLDAARGSQVCGQCHASWEFSDPQGERQANARGLPYRPGDDLAATRLIVQPTTNLDSPRMNELLAGDPGFVRDLFWSDGMVRATGREYNGLIESPCFTRAQDEARKLSCFSCHTMHKTPDDRRPLDEWADDQLAPHANENDACVRCHANSQQHSHHRTDSAGSSCYNCHMPYTTYGLLKTIRSHQISSPSVQASLDTGRPNACNLCHLDRTLAWTADALNRWYGMPKPELDGDAQRVAASVLWLLRGDAGQRAIVAQSMGWTPAQQASAAGWLQPYLALLQKDSYDAVRYIASRSLSTLPEFRRGQLPRGLAQLLINADGSFDAPTVDRLVRQRNTRRVIYRE
jgi:Cytochrome c554 and c-prime